MLFNGRWLAAERVHERKELECERVAEGVPELTREVQALACPPYSAVRIALQQSNHRARVTATDSGVVAAISAGEVMVLVGPVELEAKLCMQAAGLELTAVPARRPHRMMRFQDQTRVLLLLDHGQHFSSQSNRRLELSLPLGKQPDTVDGPGQLF